MSPFYKREFQPPVTFDRSLGIREKLNLINQLLDTPDPSALTIGEQISLIRPEVGLSASISIDQSAQGTPQANIRINERYVPGFPNTDPQLINSMETDGLFPIFAVEQRVIRHITAEPGGKKVEVISTFDREHPTTELIHGIVYFRDPQR